MKEKEGIGRHIRKQAILYQHYTKTAESEAL
jgi:hypothetical protein